VIQDDKFLYSIMPYCNGGDLYSRVMDEVESSNEGRIRESKARGYFLDILRGLNHMQKKGVVHRDLSLENVLIHDGHCVIVDLGMALRVPFVDPENEHLLTDASAGTMRRLIQAQGQGGRWTYMAPEVVSREDQFDGYAIDLWAAGVILFILLVGRSPFEMAVETDPCFNTLSSGGVKETLHHWGVPLSDEACNLLQGMMWRDPADRLNLAQVARHPWVTGRSTRRSSSPAGNVTISPNTNTRPAAPPEEPTKQAKSSNKIEVGTTIESQETPTFCCTPGGGSMPARRSTSLARYFGKAFELKDRVMRDKTLNRC
jgi:serine/threonine protein kinase